MLKTPPPRYSEPLDLWLVRGPDGARAYSNREAAERAAIAGERIYRGPRELGRLLEVCELIDFTVRAQA